MLPVNKYARYLMNTEILNYCKYLACSIQHAWKFTSNNYTCDEYRNLELLQVSHLLYTARLECYLQTTTTHT